MLKSRSEFIKTEEFIETQKSLLEMTKDTSFNTVSCYSPNIAKYPNNSMSFAEKHIEYIISHPDINLRIYISNLKLMTRIVK